MHVKAMKKAELVSTKGEHRQHRVGSVILYKDSILSVGWNRNKTHPKSPHPWKYLHAEVDAILRCKSPIPRGAELLVARIGKDGTLRNSRPCPTCMALIVASGIFKIHYTDHNTWYTLKFPKPTT
jgi:deoxycytidylate deaminase